jgi:DUF1680 family protein
MHSDRPVTTHGVSFNEIAKLSAILYAATRALPNSVERMWMRGQEDQADEIVAALFGPGWLDTQVADTRVTMQEDTRYPFEQDVSFTLIPEYPVRFAFTVRIPDWCRQPAITINGRPLTESPTPGGFCRIEREWEPGDRVVLALPFELALKRRPTHPAPARRGKLARAYVR